MGYIPPKGPPANPITMNTDPMRWEFVITPNGWWHVYWNCVNMKKCKILRAVA